MPAHTLIAEGMGLDGKNVILEQTDVIFFEFCLQL